MSDFNSVAMRHNPSIGVNQNPLPSIQSSLAGSLSVSASHSRNFYMGIKPLYFPYILPDQPDQKNSETSNYDTSTEQSLKPDVRLLLSFAAAQKMVRVSTLFALLEAEGQPTPATYKNTIDKVIEEPGQIGHLTDTDVQEDVLLQLTTRSDRLVRFLTGLHPFIRANPKSQSTSHLAVATADFLVRMLPALDELLMPAKVLGFLTPALELCLVPSTSPPLRKLASVLVNCGRLLEHLASDPFGARVFRQWASVLGTSVLNNSILELWTERMMSMVSSCKASHEVAPAIHQCYALRTLKSYLRILEARHFGEHSRSETGSDPLPLKSMTQLNKEDKKTRSSGREEPDTNILLDNEIKDYLVVFDMPEPRSWSALRNVIERLEGDETLKVLLLVATHFPCELCIQVFKSSPQTPDARIPEGSFRAIPNLQLEILGKSIGVWQILLSVQALKSLQEMSRQGLVNPIGEKLKDLASGCWRAGLAGNEAQRRRLKVPLFQTECGQNKVLLWQVDIGVMRNLQGPEQVIKVWDIGCLSEMAKAFGSVALLQRSYEPEFVRRCRQRPSVQDKKPFPARFGDSSLQPVIANGSIANLDVRAVDQSTIDLANKFFALTEPTFRAVVANDLSAEFPFDLSEEEGRVISHFQTASLILGRSGTGKTTCLIFKMVGKYLTSKAVIGETPVKQVLLTRSSFLADKLRAYARGLIKTLESQSVDAPSPANDDDPAPTMPPEESEEETVFELGDHSFPLVLTFDNFLRMLENAAKTFDRKHLGESEAIRYPILADLDQNAKIGCWQQHQLVDFNTFKLDYWPRFPKHLTRRLGVNLVFAEIMGVIKGSASSRQSLTFLSRQDYMNRSCRLAPVFVMEDERSLVYDIFERYEDMKQGHLDVDNVDRVVRIVSAIQQNMSLRQLLESAFDEVYIDEVQDQRCVDVQLLLELIKDSRGLHFAGDTAQAISQDSTFRFSDVKAMIYEHFAPVSAYANQGLLARTTMFTLSKNYRSHKSILALASLVMGMIWKGFPETVDKLDPEVGNLDGPKPILFLGCDADILRTSNVGLVNLSDRVANFGAEQVILVRDENMKAKLQGEIGDIALILTILDSKGMEFDDVILWDFFTGSADPSGIRSLSALATDAGSTFDGQRHSGMCSELKHLYVAITRARIQLFFVESSEKAMVAVVELLTSSSSGSLVDVTRPQEEDFPEKLSMLRPGTSVDPVRWSLRGDEFMQRQNYEIAAICFRKAKNHRGETIANGKVHEAKGRVCQSKNDVQGLAQHFEAAIKLFLETNMISDAAKNLERLTRFGDAAELWLGHNEIAKAAPLFAKAGLYVQAADCQHTLGNHSEAAAVLRQGEKYDEMVSYLCSNREDIPTNTFQSFNLLCKMLLKKDKISWHYRKAAIEVLGSPTEQQAFFIQYEMYEPLADLYLDQQMYKDLFDLLATTGQLEKALRLVITESLSGICSGIAQSRIMKVLDYVCAGRMATALQQKLVVDIRSVQGLATSELVSRTKQWEACCGVYLWEAPGMLQLFANLEDTVVTRFLSFQTVLHLTSIFKASSLDDLSLEVVLEATRVMKDLVLKSDDQAQATVLLLTGLWKYDDTQDKYIVLPWSPLKETLTELGILDAPRLAKQLVLDQLASAMLSLDSMAREKWKETWPSRCLQFMTIGHNLNKARGEKCHRLHEKTTPHACSRKFGSLLQVNSVFCELSVVYYHRIMKEEFQEKFLGVRRHWLERLLRELTPLSAIEQVASTIMDKQAELCCDRKWIAVSSSLEELLYFRLVKEWSMRSNFTSLLEQMQRAQAFSPNLQNRIFRALSHRLHIDGKWLLQHHLGLLNSLEQNIGSHHATAFESKLNVFLRNLDNINVPSLSTLHALTAVFEYLVAYLILKTCVATCVLTQAWIDLYVPRFINAIHSLEPMEWFEWNHKYQQCLMNLTKAFCRILRRLNEVPPPGVSLSCSGKTHHPLLLQQRNAELVAIVVANLALAPTSTSGLTELWTTANEVFGYGFVRAYHLRSPTPFEVTQKLADSFVKYNDMNALILVIKDRSKGAPSSSLDSALHMKTVPFDQLCPRAPTPAATDASSQIHLSTSTDTPQEEYTARDKDAVIKAQRLWRSCSLRLKNRRSYMQLPEARAIAHFISIGEGCPPTLTFIDRPAFRHVLISHGVTTTLRLVVARDTLSALQKEAMACVEKLEISTGLFESIDDVLHQNSQVETLLKKADELMSDECLVAVVKIGVLSELEEVMKDAGEIVAEAEQAMLETRKIVDAVSRNCT